MKSSSPFTPDRRDFLAATAAAGAAVLAPSLQLPAAETPWKPNYMLASSMYGFTALKEIVPEVHKVGANTLDIWPKGHGNQREQLDEMGEDVFAALLKKHDVRLGCITQYKLGPFGIQEEMRLARRLGCTTIVCGGKGPRGLKGSELKAAVGLFIEQMKPHLAVAEETGVTIAIENHGSNLIETPDSLKWLVKLRPSKHLAIALAPYHLPQEEKMLSDLIRALKGGIEVFYAWQHGMGCHVKLPKEQELLQMPGRGELDFAPLVEALAETNYDRWTEIFMHPVPRGIPILEPTAAVTEEINRSRTYLAQCLKAK
jgi:sugar phosphate isomerase/epimerase